jgi:ribonuclease D
MCLAVRPATSIALEDGGKGARVYVRTERELEELVRALEPAEVLAVDTEFMRERTYYAKLCLVQVASDDVVAAVDPLAVDDLGPLWELLLDGSRLKVLHAGEQDLEIFFRLTGDVPGPVFDTQVAAALASFPLQVGYGALVRELLGVELDKMDSYSDWSRRPLSEMQVEYAMNDVRHLTEVYRHLEARLAETGRRDWLDEDFAALADPESYRVVPEETWRRVKRRARLGRRELGILKHLAAWREREAMRIDVPRNRIGNDEALVQIAAKKPDTLEEVRAVRGLGDRTAKRSAGAIIEAVRAGLAMPESELPVLERRPRARMDVDAVTDLMSAVVRTRAREYGIAVPVLASRKEMESLARGDREDSALLKGWRRSHVGEELLELLDGKLRLGLENGSVHIEGRTRTDG